MEVQATSVDHEWALHVGALVRSKAIKKGKMIELKWEVGVLKDLDSTEGDVTDELLKKYQPARNAAAKLIEPLSSESGGVLLQNLVAKQNVLLDLDCTASVEIAALKLMQGQAGRQVMHQNILNTLPSATREISYEECLARLQNVISNGSVQYLPPDSKSLATTVLSLISNMQHGRAPDMDALRSGDFGQQVGKKAIMQTQGAPQKRQANVPQRFGLRQRKWKRKSTWVGTAPGLICECQKIEHGTYAGPVSFALLLRVSLGAPAIVWSRSVEADARQLESKTSYFLSGYGQGMCCDRASTGEIKQWFRP